MNEKQLRRDALAIFRASLKAADPVQAILRHVRREGELLIAGRRKYPLDRYERIFVIGAGKAGAAMGRAVEDLLGARIFDGWLNVKYGHTRPLKRIRLHECGHPMPDPEGQTGAMRILELAQKADRNDLVLCLFSGGGSALLAAPAPPVSLDEKREVTRLLLGCGASIDEINAVRKHISLVKGGQLARAASPATVLTLILSDVIGDRLDVIASGPTSPDPATYAGALAVLDRYGLRKRVPPAVRDRLEQGHAGKWPETPKPGDAAFRSVQNLIVGSNRLAVQAAAQEARRRGYRPLVLSTTIEGETRDVARVHAAIAREVAASGQPVRPPACVISGGETTVTLRGDGLGGRNQEFVLAAAIDLDGARNTVVLSAGTDGTDGPTDAAGALADGHTITRAAARDLAARRYLDGNNSYRFFDPLGDLIRTGATNTNVMDVRLLLIG